VSKAQSAVPEILPYLAGSTKRDVGTRSHTSYLFQGFSRDMEGRDNLLPVYDFQKQVSQAWWMHQVRGLVMLGKAWDWSRRCVCVWLATPLYLLFVFIRSRSRSTVAFLTSRTLLLILYKTSTRSYWVSRFLVTLSACATSHHLRRTVAWIHNSS